MLGLLLRLAPPPPVWVGLRGRRLVVGPGHLRPDGDVKDEVAATRHAVGPNVQETCADWMELRHKDFKADGGTRVLKGLGKLLGNAIVQCQQWRSGESDPPSSPAWRCIDCHWHWPHWRTARWGGELPAVT